ncbi:MAG: T9SS type A sorting domain-containing protein [Parvicellaceae bacterium]
MKFTKLFLFFFISFLSPTLISQTLYGLKKTVNGSMSIPFDVVSIDPFTGTTTFEVSTNSLVAVAAGATAYDQQNKRFFCWGFNTSNSKRLYVMDIDDSVSNNFNLPSVQPIEIEYDLQHQKLYGLWWDGSVEHFGEIDIQTGTATSIATLAGVNAVAIGNSTFDSNTGRFIFIGVSGNQTKLYSINVLDGSILSSPTIYQNGNRFSALEFNINNNTLYGLVQDIDSSNYSQSFFNYYTNLRIAEIDIYTGSIVSVNAQNPVISGYLPGYAIGGLCFDQSTQTYIIYVQNEVGTFLKMVDVISGNILASTPLTNNDYFYELQVDNYDFARSFYNLSKVENRISSAPEIHLYPNPATHILKYNSDFEIDKITIFNTIGQKIMEQNKPVGNFIELKEMNRGIYYLQFQSSQHIVSKQFIIK